MACANLVQFGSATSPAILNVTPVNGATNLSFNNNVTKAIYLRANITDINGDLKYILFETNRTGNWSKIADANITGNWTTSTYVPFTNLTKNTKYWWRIKARDNTNNWTNTTVYSFTIGKASTGGGNGTGGGGTSKVNITIVPSEPKSGGTVIFLINKNNASGYVICNATMNVYPILFTQGLGSIKLDDDYGPALVYIVNYGTKLFTIKHEYQGNLLIDAPFSADVNEKVDIAVLSQGEYVSATLSFTSPSNHTTSRQTGKSGPISYTFIEAGDWTLHANAYYTNITKKIYINPDPIEITVSENIEIGHETVINVNSPNAEVVIKKGDATWTYQSDSNGEILFEPLFSGRYTITATSSNQKGTKTFDVKSRTEMSIINTKGKAEITEGDVLIMQIQDTEGNSVKSGSLEIYGDGVPIQTLEYDGITYWTATPQAKIYEFHYVPDSELFIASQETVRGVPPDMTMIYIGVTIIAIIIFISVLLLNRAGYLNIGALKGLSGGVKDDLL